MLAATRAILACLLLLAAPARGEMRDQTKIKAGTPPAVVLKELFQANRAAVERDAMAPSGSKFAPYLTWLADSDPRLQAETLLPATREMIYSVRNFGYQVATTPGTLDYGILYLHTPVLLITGNTDNQAVKLAMEDPAALEPELRRELSLLQPALGPDNPKEPFAERWRKNIEANVDYQVGRAMSRYAGRVEGGRLVVIGAVIDLTNEYRRGRGRLVVINVNGEKEPEQIRKLQHLAPFDRKLLELYLGRYRAEPGVGVPTPIPAEPPPAAAEPEAEEPAG